MDSFIKGKKIYLYYFTILLIISLPGKVNCFDVEKCSSFILYLLFILFFLALLGNYNVKKRGYQKIDGSIQNSTKL